LLSVVSKLFTRVLNNRLNLWAEANSKFHIGQSGFRAGFGTMDNVYVLQAFIEHACQEKEELFCCFVDYEKAFDRVDHTVLWYKLDRMGVTGNIFRVIKDMYRCLKSCVRHFSGEESEAFISICGVRQGETLSPFLFACVLKDMEEHILSSNNNSEHAMRWGSVLCALACYADDCVIMSKTELGLQSSINAAQDYCTTWRLRINIAKTKVVVFNPRYQRALKFSIDGNVLEVVPEFNFLGVTLFHDCDLKKTADRALLKAKKALFALRRHQAKFYQTPMDIIRDFRTLVEPILLYGCEIWGRCAYSDATTFYNKFHKDVLGVKKTTPTHVWLRETGAMPFKDRVNQRMISFWAGLTRADHDRAGDKLSRLVMNEQRKMTGPSWTQHMARTMRSYGLANHWTAQAIGRKDVFMRIAKRNIQDTYFTELERTNATSSKGELHRILTPDWKPKRHEFYLDSIDYPDAVRIARFRMRSHWLAIEAGTMLKPIVAKDNRVCNTCGTVEDEFHFIFDCIKYEDLRRKYITYNSYDNMSEYEMLRSLFNTKNVRTLYNLSIFIKKAEKFHAEYAETYLMLLEREARLNNQ